MWNSSRYLGKLNLTAKAESQASQRALMSIVNWSKFYGAGCAR
jgi:hypothetical protein